MPSDRQSQFSSQISLFSLALIDSKPNQHLPLHSSVGFLSRSMQTLITATHGSPHLQVWGFALSSCRFGLCGKWTSLRKLHLIRLYFVGRALAEAIVGVSHCVHGILGLSGLALCCSSLPEAVMNNMHQTDASLWSMPPGRTTGKSRIEGIMESVCARVYVCACARHSLLICEHECTHTSAWATAGSAKCT